MAESKRGKARNINIAIQDASKGKLLFQLAVVGMNPIYKILIFGKPVPKGRPRFTRKGWTYTPKKTRIYEDYVKFVAISQTKIRKPIVNPIKVEISFYLQRPESRKKYPYPDVKPDIDNLIKSVIDGLQGIVFHDDKQIISLHANKLYSNDKPRTEIYIQEVEE